MIGTLLNVATILVGGLFGMGFGAHLPERMRRTVVAGLGLFTLCIGIQMFLKTENAIIVLCSLLIGGVLGEWWQIENRLEGLGGFLEEKLAKLPGSGQAQVKDPLKAPEEGGQRVPLDARQRFIRGFLTSSLVFCIGPMAILGSIQDGLSGNFNLLAIKAVLDGFGALAFASTLGVGVLFSSLVILIYQGSISLLAVQAQSVFSQSMLNEMTAVGGLMLVGLALSSLLEVKPIRIGSFLPALALAPLIVAILGLFH